MTSSLLHSHSHISLVMKSAGHSHMHFLTFQDGCLHAKTTVATSQSI